jgi:Rrf2 family protein
MDGKFAIVARWSTIFVAYSTLSLALKRMLTAKGKYSLKALAHLAALDTQAMTQAIDIAEANGIPKKFLDAILGELRNAGIVQSQKGPGGGYRLARVPSEIRIGHVIRTIDGPLAPIACASRTAYQPCRDCSDVRACSVRLMMTKVRDAISDVLDRVTLADMIATGGRRNMARINPARKSRALSRASATGRASRKSPG